MCKVYLGAEQMLIRPAFIFAFFFFGNYFFRGKTMGSLREGPERACSARSPFEWACSCGGTSYLNATAQPHVLVVVFHI